MRRWPKRSGSVPVVSRKLARPSAYASTTHCSSEKLECRSLAMSGSATFTTVMSSSSMNVATQTAASVHQRFGCFSGTAVHRDLGAADRRAGVAAQELDDLGDLRRPDPRRVVGVRHGGGVGRGVEGGGQHGVDADALVAVLGVQGTDEGQQRGLGGNVPGCA